MVILMERYDRIISLIWIALGAGQCLESWLLGLGSVAEPGTGFMPFVVGLILIALSTLLLVESTLKGMNTPATRVSPWAEIQWKRIIYVIILLLVYSLLLPKLGYLIATFLLMVFLLRSMEPLSWPAAVTVGVLTSVVSYLIFNVWLQVSFPRGILSF